MIYITCESEQQLQEHTRQLKKYGYKRTVNAFHVEHYVRDNSLVILIKKF